MSMAVDVAPPAMPLPSTKVATAKMVGHRLPKTCADSPKIGINTVLDTEFSGVSVSHSTHSAIGSGQLPTL